jgi:hypothetical protein
MLLGRHGNQQYSKIVGMCSESQRNMNREEGTEYETVMKAAKREIKVKL